MTSIRPLLPLLLVAACGWSDQGAAEVVDDDVGASSGPAPLDVLGDGPWAECTWREGSPKVGVDSDVSVSCPYPVFSGGAVRIANAGSVAYVPLDSGIAQAYVRVEGGAAAVIDAQGRPTHQNLHFVDAAGRLSAWSSEIDFATGGAVARLGTFDGLWTDDTHYRADWSISNPTALVTLAREPLFGFVNGGDGLGYALRETPSGWDKEFVADFTGSTGWRFGIDTFDRVFVTAFREIAGQRWQLASRSGADSPLILAEVEPWEVGALSYPEGVAPGDAESVSSMVAFSPVEDIIRVYASGLEPAVVPDSEGLESGECVPLSFDDAAFEECSSQCREEISGRTSWNVASSWIDERRVLLTFVRSRISHEITLWETCGFESGCECSYEQRVRELEATLRVMTFDVRTGQFADLLQLELLDEQGEGFVGGHTTSVSVDGRDVAILVSDEISSARILQLTLPP